ncbi:hypothetical protein AAFF_G00099760 [Aldrovandia affinis]|uniref:Uncharacterized protein n=1 Tax=Aldrovandia affinis TaxID=143900 RepID=A0AAD7RUY1_9TELE|nr:hypothetical protein AAFF_G00099760 [Aldrovandia affinis]
MLTLSSTRKSGAQLGGKDQRQGGLRVRDAGARGHRDRRALFILGALYSIKVMHRKRRSGYKRQRRKHREAGSRQDRVMLLADSSEDEF